MFQHYHNRTVGSVQKDKMLLMRYWKRELEYKTKQSKAHMCDTKAFIEKVLHNVSGKKLYFMFCSFQKIVEIFIF